MKWQKVKLGEVVTAHYGKALKAEERDSDGEFDVFGSSGFVGKHSSTLTDKPTLIIGRKGSVGAVTYAPCGGWTIDTAYFLEIKGHVELDLRFLFYTLNNAKLPELAITTSIPGLNRESFYRVEIPLPPLDEQKRIASILDAAEALRRVSRQRLELFKALEQSLFLEMFGDPATNPKEWDVRKLGEVVDIERNGINPEDIESGTAYIALENIEKGGDLSNIGQVAEGELASTKFQFGNQHLLYGKLRPYLCKIAMPNFTGICSTDILPLLPRTEILREILSYTLRHSHFVSMATMLSTGANLPRLSPSALAEFPIPLPPLSLQQTFAGQIEELERIKARGRAQLGELDALFASLQERAFDGRL